MAIIEIKNLNFSYDATDVLRNLNLSVETGSFLAIAGPNGAGKSTLINLMCRILRPDSGEIRILDKDIKFYSFVELAKQIAVVRQEFVPVFGFSVFETVAMARTAFLRGLGFETGADMKIIREALESTDTAQFGNRTLGQLSGGERQRVFIARALAQQTPILLLDEPTSFLDLKHQIDIYDLLKKMQLEYGKTIVLITHDINVAVQYCDNLLLIGADKEYRFGNSEQIFSAEVIEKFFGVKGFSANIGLQKFFLPLGELAKDKKCR